MSETEGKRERRPVNPYAAVHVGKRNAGEEYNVYNMNGDLIKEGATVTPQGTIYVGAQHEGTDVVIEPA